MVITAQEMKALLNEKGWGKKLMSTPNVVGYSAAPARRIKDGKETDEMVLRVYVKKKHPKDILSAQVLVPQEIGGIRTDVVEIGEIKALGWENPGPKGISAQEYKERLRPCPPGYSIGHKDITAGTFGVVVKDLATGANSILSNNHVLANQNKAQIGSEILQPGKADGGTVANDTMARLTRFVTINIGGGSGCTLSNAIAGGLNWISKSLGRKTRFKTEVEATANKVDCAIATPINQADILLEVKDIGKPTGTVEIAVGDEVHKTGRTTGHTHLTVSDVNYSGNVQYSDGIAFFEDQILAYGKNVTGSKGGDSGSSGFKADGDGTLLGALLFAGSDTQNVTIFNKIQNVFAQLNVELAT